MATDTLLNNPDQTYIQSFLYQLSKNDKYFADDYVGDTNALVQQFGQKASLTMAEFPGVTGPRRILKDAQSGPGAATKGNLTIAFKSIQPPKFSTEISGFSAKDTIFTVKSQLLNDFLKPNNKVPEDTTEVDLRLLEGSKVLNDSKLLEEIFKKDNKIVNILVLVAKRAAKAQTVTSKPNEIMKEDKLEIPEAAWLDISITLNNHLGTDTGTSALDRLKRGWRATDNS